MVSITKFKKILKRYNGKMPIYKFLYHFPDCSVSDLEYLIKKNNLKVIRGFIEEDTNENN